MASSTSAATPISILTDRERVIGELTRGREIADMLRLMLRETGFDGCASAQDLVGRILDSFTQSISVLCAGGESDEVSQVPAVVNSPRLKSEGSGDSCKTPVTKDRRGCYKRKKTSETWAKETPSMFDDGHAWRKYGQKTILHTRFPRSYYRCTHKLDQGCQASKQVQQIQEDPPLFRATYSGRHTCKNLISPHQIIIDDPAQDSSLIWSFQSPEPAGFKLGKGFVIDSTEDNNKGVIKLEKELDDYRVSSGPDYQDLTVFDASNDHLGAFSSGSDPGEVFSCTASTHGMDMDFIMVGPDDFDDFLELESLS